MALALGQSLSLFGRRQFQAQHTFNTTADRVATGNRYRNVDRRAGSPVSQTGGFQRGALACFEYLVFEVAQTFISCFHFAWRRWGDRSIAFLHGKALGFGGPLGPLGRFHLVGLHAHPFDFALGLQTVGFRDFVVRPDFDCAAAFRAGGIGKFKLAIG